MQYTQSGHDYSLIIDEKSVSLTLRLGFERQEATEEDHRLRRICWLLLEAQ